MSAIGALVGASTDQQSLFNTSTVYLFQTGRSTYKAGYTDRPLGERRRELRKLHNGSLHDDEPIFAWGTADGAKFEKLLLTLLGEMTGGPCEGSEYFHLTGQQVAALACIGPILR